jgi:hypothetical protein
MAAVRGLCHPCVQVLGNASFTQAVMNVLNILTGVGLLSIPFALRQAGWAGLAILWVLGIVTNYTGVPTAHCLAVPTALPTLGYSMRQEQMVVFHTETVLLFHEGAAYLGFAHCFFFKMCVSSGGGPLRP